MNIKVFQDFPIRARVAYAIMCCERYVAAVYPELDLRPLSDLMWHIVDGSESVDNASYKCSENIPKYLCNYNTYEDFCGGLHPYTSEEEFYFFKQLLFKCKDDADLEKMMKNIYDIPMDFAYTSIPPLCDYPASLDYLQQINDILEQHRIELPDFNLLAQYAVSEMSPEKFKRYGWFGEPIQPQDLSIYIA